MPLNEYYAYRTYNSDKNNTTSCFSKIKIELIIFIDDLFYQY